MSDFIEEYQKRVRKRLIRKQNEPADRTIDLLCFPSFHPETLLQVSQSGTLSTLRICTFASSLWYGGQDDTPKRLSEKAAIAPARSTTFWNQCESLLPVVATEQVQSLGVDGITIQIACGGLGPTTEFETWCPLPHTATGQLVNLVYDLAWEVISSDASIERLEQLHGYLHRGLPARILHGDITCLRLFGGLSTQHQQELDRLFESLQGDEPLVVDMTNFEGMGTLLYPIFAKFARSKPRLHWASSQRARTHLEAIGIPSNHIFQTRDSAVANLRNGT